MPIPRELLRAVFAGLPEEKLRAAGYHCFDRQLSASEIVAQARGKKIQRDSDRLSVAELVEKLSADDGQHLKMISNGDWLLSIPDLEKIYAVLGIDGTVLKPAEMHHAVWKFVADYDKEQERQAFHQKTAVPRFPKDELIAQVRQLAKPCIHLTRNPKDGPFAGLWGGPGIVPAPPGDPAARPKKAEAEKYRHWITFDCSQLPEEFAPLELRGAACVYADQWCGYMSERNEMEEGWVARDPDCVFQQSPELLIRAGGQTRYRDGDEGTPLFARAGLSYPSRFQLIDHATPAIRDWLSKMGYSFEENDYDSFAVLELKDVYEQFIYDLNPIFKLEAGIVAVVGGWTIDIEYTYAQMLGDRCYQLVFTFEDAEPWIQAAIGKRTGKYYVRKLIT